LVYLFIKKFNSTINNLFSYIIIYIFKMMTYDLTKYSTHALIGFAGVVAYDTLIEGYKLDGGFSYNDAATFALSTVVSNVTYDILSSFLPYLNEGSLPGLIGKPLINALVYSYMFDMMLNKKYPGIRDSTNAFVVGAIGDLLLGYVESPILALFGVKLNGY